jgi:hypothetical protein
LEKPVIQSQHTPAGAADYGVDLLYQRLATEEQG